jgi:hypothetical protein
VPALHETAARNDRRARGRLRFLATIGDPPIVTKILAHLGLPTKGPALTPARPPPQPGGFDFP